MMYSVLNVCFTVTPLLVTLTTLGVYVYLDPVNNILTAEKVFSCIAIFNVLRMPLTLFPMTFMETIKLIISLKRINSFLKQENVQELQHSIDEQPNKGNYKIQNMYSFICF